MKQTNPKKPRAEWIGLWFLMIFKYGSASVIAIHLNQPTNHFCWATTFLLGYHLALPWYHGKAPHHHFLSPSDLGALLQQVCDLGVGRQTQRRPEAAGKRRKAASKNWGHWSISWPSKSWGDPLVMTNIAMENHHAINGKIHYFYGHFQ